MNQRRSTAHHHLRPGDFPPVFCLLAGALVYVSFGFTEMMGSDLWWHLAGGREILQNGSPWLRDDWSFTARGEPWRNHEWGAQLLFQAWIRLFGVASLVYWKLLLIATTFLLLQRVLLRRCGHAGAALLAASAAAAIAAPFLDLRPQLYTLLAIALLLNIAWRRQPRLWELLLLFLCWVNVHGGFFFGLLLLAILRFPWEQPGREALLRWVRVLLICGAVTLLNPDGWRAFAYPLEYALNADSPYRGLAEWHPPFEGGGIRSPLYFWGLILGACLALTWLLPALRRRAAPDPEALAAAALAAAMSLTSRRFIILYAMALAMLIARPLAALLQQRLFQVLRLSILLLVSLFGAYRLYPYLPLRPQVAFHYLAAEYAYPHGAVDFMQANGLQGDVFAYYNWGGFLHWRSDGALRVYIDGRANTLYDDATFRRYQSIAGARPGALTRLAASGAQFVLWPVRGRSAALSGRLQRSPRWRMLYSGARAAVFVREDQPLGVSRRVPVEPRYRDLAASWAAYSAGRNEDAAAFADAVLDQYPWDRDACVLRSGVFRRAGAVTEAEAVVEGCMRHFPSRFLR